MTIAMGYDDTEEYGWTRAMHHTDKQGGAPGRNELITAALGGKLQGRIEPHPHSLVVSWSDPDPAIARLVVGGRREDRALQPLQFRERGAHNDGAVLADPRRGIPRSRWAKTRTTTASSTPERPCSGRHG